MIPLRLAASNLMTYSQLELDFSKFRIACLSGQNGSGKSTILDAITWVLWERARSGSEDLIRIGEQEVRVEFDFRLEQQAYRIIRSRKRRSAKAKSSGKSVLEFQILSETGFKPLTGKSIRETQQRIVDTLRMDYSLFINSSFILQGRADEFTLSAPSDRKKILADILNLGLYDRLQDQAREKRLLLQKEQAQLQGKMAHLQQRVTGLDLLTAEQEQMASAHLEARHSLEQIKAEELALREQAATLEQQQFQLEQVRRQLEQLERAADQQQETNQALAQKLQALATLMAQQAEIETGYRHWQALQAQKSQCEEQAESYNQLQEKRNQVYQLIIEAKHQLELETRALEQLVQQQQKEKNRYADVLAEKNKIAAGYEKLQQCQGQENSYHQRHQQYQELEYRRRELDERLQEALQREKMEKHRLETLLGERKNQLRDARGLEKRFQRLHQQLLMLARNQELLERVTEDGILVKQRNEHLMQQIMEADQALVQIRQKIEQLHAQDASACPLCNHALSKPELQKLVGRYQDDFEQIEQERLERQHRLSEQEQQLQELRSQHLLLQKEMKLRDGLQQEFGQMEKQVQENERLQAEIQLLQQQLLQIDVRLLDKQVMPEVQQELALLKRQLEALGFDTRELALIQAAVKDWQWAEGKHRELVLAEASLAGLTPLLAENARQLAALKQQLQQKQFAMIEQQIYQEVCQQMEPLRPAIQALRELRTQLPEYQGFAERWQQLQQALLQQEAFSSQWQQGQALSADQEQQIQAFRQELADQAGVNSAWQELRQRLRACQEQLPLREKAEKDLHARCFALAREIERVQEQVRELAQFQQQQEALAFEIYLHQELADICGKNGIQAVIIENAIPEIEQVANQILSKMTDGRMHVKFQTLRSQKTREQLVETLDIFISDELGTRNYETYSAGEAFRVNFAIRLAISRFLARRAGAKLQTLVIDEGFGTQDTDGKFRIVEAINSVADEFATIIIITHIDDLKEMFPVRIEVMKQNTGSVIHLVN